MVLNSVTDIQQFLEEFNKDLPYKVYFVIYDNGTRVKERRFTDVQFHNKESMKYKFRFDINCSTIAPEVFYVKLSEIVRINICDIDQIALYE